MRRRGARMSARAWWRNRLIARAFLRGGGGWAGARARQLLASAAPDDDLRGLHDRLHAPLRSLGADGVGAFELDEVGAWLDADLKAAGAPSRAPSARFRRASAALAAACVLLLAAFAWFTLATPARRPPALLGMVEASGFVARGGAGGDGLALEALCGPRVRFARPDGCDRGEELTFAVRVSGSLGPGQVSIFGIDASGNTLYYAPTPVDPAPVFVGPGETDRWRSAGFAVRLRVNHDPGAVRVFSLYTPRPVSVDQIDAWAAALVANHGPGVDPDVDLLTLLGLVGSDTCPDAGDCAAATLDLSIHPERSPASDAGAP